MSIEITARHLNIGEHLQTYARERAEAIMEAFPKTEFVHVILDHERHLFIAEFVAQHKGPFRVESSNEHEDMVAAIDGASEKINRQLRKHRDKVVDHRH